MRDSDDTHEEIQEVHIEESSDVEETVTLQGKVQAVDLAPITMGGTGGLEIASLALSTSMSLFHIQSAFLFARQSHAIEVQYQSGNIAPSDLDDRAADYRGYVTGAIFMSVAFLDASAWELMDPALNKTNAIVQALGEATIQQLDGLWQRLRNGDTRSLPKLQTTLDKFQAMLSVAGKQQFTMVDQNFPPAEGSFPDVEKLTQLRNKLVHYRPLWEVKLQAGGPTAQQQEPRVTTLKQFLEAKFQSAPNPLISSNSFFLDTLLSHACAKWAANSALAFADTFYRAMSLPVPYEYARRRLAAV